MNPLTVMIVAACFLLLMLVPTGWAFLGTGKKSDRWIYIGVILGSIAVLVFLGYIFWDEILKYAGIYFRIQEIRENIREMVATPGPQS